MTIQVEGLAMIFTEVYWVGSRLYTIQIAVHDKFPTYAAGNYFLDSFHLD